MIHSLSGGNLRDNKILDVVKIKFISNPLALDRPYWYKSEIALLKEGDTVLAPFGKNGDLYKAQVLKIDKGVNEQVTPVPFSKMQYIHSVVSE